MGRYSKSKIGRHRSGKNNLNRKDVLSYKTTLYAKIPELDSDIQIITQDGDRLDNLSMTFYKTPSLWWYIAKANNLTDVNVPTGTTLRIPISVDYAKGK